MPWGWGGRGFRWMFWLTGLPGWARFSYGYPAYGYGYPYRYATWPAYNWFWRCRWFPWLPRWWWTGMYGPVQWTPQGPMLTSQPSTQTIPTQPINEIEALKQEKQILEQELKDIEKRLKELEERR